MHDILIIGGGPAGLSAAITARARNKDVLVISNASHENPLAASKLVDNYPGMPGASGIHILNTMHAQAHELGVQFLQARAISIVPMQGSDSAHNTFSVTTSSDFVEAKSLIIACGASSGGSPIEGEMEFLGKGVSYCATCDGMLYRSSTVLIVGLSAEAADEADFMAELGATVHYIARKVPPGLDDRIYKHSGKVLSIQGDALGVTHAIISEYPLTSLQDTKDEANTAQQANADAIDTQLDVNGVFILRPGLAPTNMLPTLETEDGYIKVDASMRTNAEGVFAAGDCTGKPLQIAKAVGQGQIAVLSAVEYMSANVER